MMFFFYVLSCVWRHVPPSPDSSQLPARCHYEVLYVLQVVFCVGMIPTPPSPSSPSPQISTAIGCALLGLCIGINYGPYVDPTSSSYLTSSLVRDSPLSVLFWWRAMTRSIISQH